jgi:hypothetical protein
MFFKSIPLTRLERFSGLETSHEVVIWHIRRFKMQVRFFDDSCANKLLSWKRIALDEPASDLFPIVKRVL